MSGGLLSFFWDLAGDSETRQQAVAGLLAQLEGEQKEYTANGEDGEPLCSNLAYSLKRLVRGLASSRAGARQGFSLALTRILATFSVVQTSSVMALINKHITNAQSHNKQERRDFYIGRIFAVLVLLRSSRLADLPDQQLSTAVRQLLDFCNTLALREISFSTIAAVVDASSFERVQQVVWPALAEQFDGKDAEVTPEHVALAVTLQRKFKANNMKAPSAFVRRVLSSRHFGELTVPLKEAARVHPRVHFVWKTLLQELYKKQKWATLWSTCIDGLFTSHAFSHQYLGFQLFDMVIRHLADHPSDHAYEQMAPLFSANFIKCCTHHLANKSRRLFKCATHTTRKVLVECADKDSKVAFAIVNHLVGGGGGKPFDEETYRQLLSKLNDSDVEAHVATLNQSFTSAMSSLTQNEDEEKEEALLTTCKASLQQLFAVARYRTNYTQHISSFLALLMKYAFFEKDDDEVPEELVSMCAARFNTLIAELTKPLTKPKRKEAKEDKKGDEQKESKAAKTKTVVWVLKMHDTWGTLLSDGYTPRIDPEGEHESLRGNMLKTVKALNKKKRKEDASRQSQRDALKVLLPYLGLLMLSEPEDTAPLLTDLIACSRALNTTSPDSQHILVLLEILLALLSRESTLLRDISTNVFRAFSGELTKDAVRELLRALQIQQDDEEEDDDGDVFEVTDRDEKQSKAPTVSIQTVSESDSDSDSDSDSVGEEKSLPFTRGAAEESEEEIDDLDQLASVLMGSDLAEEERERQDAALAGLVNLKQQKKKQQAELVRQTHHFQLRVLDLVETYIQKQGSSRHMLILLAPLVDGMSGNRGRNKTGGSKHQFLTRLQAVIVNKLCKSSPEVTPSDATDLLELLNGFFARAHKSAKKEVQLVLNRACLFCIKLLLRLAEKQKTALNTEDTVTPKALKAVREALKRYISIKNSAVHTWFFVDIFERYPVLAWHLLPFLAKLLASGKAANAYLLHDGWVLMGRLLGSRALLRADPALRTLFLQSVPGFSLALSNSVKALGQIPTQSEELPKWGRFAKYVRTVLKTACTFRHLVQKTVEEGKEVPQVLTSAVKSSLECLPGALTALLIPALSNLYRLATWDIPTTWSTGDHKRKGKGKTTDKKTQQKRKRTDGKQSSKQPHNKKAKTKGEAKSKGKSNGNTEGGKKKKKNGRERARERRKKQEAKRAEAKKARAAVKGAPKRRDAPGSSPQPKKKAKTGTKKKSKKTT